MCVKKSDVCMKVASIVCVSRVLGCDELYS